MEKDLFTLARLEATYKQNIPQYQKLFEEFISSYSVLCNNLDNPVQDAFGGDINTLVQVSYNEKLVYNYLNDYNDYVNGFYSLFCNHSKIHFSNVDFEGFVQKAQSIGYIGYIRQQQKPTTAMIMQFVSVTSQIVEFLHQIYGAITHKAPAYSYMEIGAKILNYTDRKMFRKMYNAMLKINDPSIARCISDISLKNDYLINYPFRHNSQFYGERAAMADYSYSFKAKFYPKIQIAHVQLIDSLLCSQYKESDCSLKFGLGLQAAIFEVPKKHDYTVLSFAGTQPFGGRTVNNIYTDLCQIFHGPETTYLAAVGILSEVARVVKGQIKVVGHSLGGGLMQYACAAIDDARIAGTGFNSAGLSTYSCYTLTGERIHRSKKRIEHVCSYTDPISKVGKQIGTVGHIETHRPFSHSIDHLNETLNKGVISCYV